MHREFRKLLEKAEGSSEFVMAINADIRGFTSFSTTVESVEVAVFIKRVYMRLVDEYFTDASFFKPTGDGLLLIVPYEEQSLKRTATSTVTRCLKAVRNFGRLCKKDPMINFQVPDKIGIGLSRGSACCLRSGNKILDYSGAVLNVASRLMDLARPGGLVFDSSFGISLLRSNQRKLFAKDTVYLKGIAERDPIEVHYSKEHTIISALHKHPVEDISWASKADKNTLKEIKDLGGMFRYKLPTKPLDASKIMARVTHPCVVAGKKKKNIWTTFQFTKVDYFLEAGKPLVRVDFDTLARNLEANGVKPSWHVKIELTYPSR